MNHSELSLGRFEDTDLDWVQVLEFLEESNAIESEYSQIAMDDAIWAWNYAVNPSEDINGIVVMDIDMILGIHNNLMKRLRPDIAGKIRDCDVWIGGKHCPFISEALIKDDLNKWIGGSHMRRYPGDDLEVLMKRSHVSFEYIHPFEDGNGRVGRIIMNVLRLYFGLPLLIIYKDNVADYYQWFKEEEK